MDSTKTNRFFNLTLKIITLLFIIIVLRVLYLTIFNKNNTKDYNDPLVAARVVRGDIVDTNDKILAIEIPYYSCSLRVDKIDDLQKIANICAPFLNMNVDSIVEKASQYKYQALIKKRINDDNVSSFIDKVKSLNLENIIKIEKKTGRDYIQSFHASQTIGFVGDDNIGLEGIEYTLNNYLSPSPELNKEVTYGDTVQLTLDMNIQYLLDLEVQKINSKFDPESIVGIVLDAKTGDILAMTSYPWYDLNNISSSTPDERQNKSLSMLYEPGSVFKIFSLPLLMDIGQADFNTPFDCDGSFVFNQDSDPITINCTHVHGEVTPIEMLKVSCNGAISTWALQTNSEEYFKKLCDFGFNSKIELPLNGISRSRISDPSLWSIRSKPTISFGQELNTTAINLVTAATAITNEGILLKPHIVKAIIDSSGNIIKERTIEKGNTLFSTDIAQIVLEGMEAATQEGGTAIYAAIDGLRVGAKTGTAQIYNPKTKSYDDGGVLASTLAIVPIENPKYIIYFAAKAPTKGSIWGSNIAAPAIHNILEGLLAQNKLKINSN
ncbi:MAG: penicillin-binding protein 2 [Spirochaetaceae bacterium]|nr:penicillin-binding protein 2 [Spirochaetaceae bacterium]